MRFGVEISLENEKLNKDKNRMILSLLKYCYSSYNQNYFNDLYKKNPVKRKSFTFSIYMGECKFLKEEIFIPEKKLILNFSTSDMKDGIMFYNSFLINKGKGFPVKNNTLNIEKINMINEKHIYKDEVILKTMSPIVVREHKGNNKETWYYSLDDAKGKEIFMSNLKYQLLEEFGEDRRLDIEEIKVEVLSNKEVKAKHYGIVILSNLCKIKVIGKPYLLDYIYRSGIGSRKNSGFGMLDIV